MMDPFYLKGSLLKKNKSNWRKRKNNKITSTNKKIKIKDLKEIKISQIMNQNSFCKKQ